MNGASDCNQSDLQQGIPYISRVSQEKFTRFVSYGIKSMRPMFFFLSKSKQFQHKKLLSTVPSKAGKEKRPSVPALGGTMFNTEMLICQSKDNLEEKMLFIKVSHLDPESRNTLVKGMFGNENSTFNADP